MQSPEEKWDDLLKDVDMTGLGNPNKWINRVHVKGGATPNQTLVYDLIREMLRPYEDFYHGQAVDFATNRPLPPGVRRSWGWRLPLGYHFLFTTPSGLHLPADLQPQRKGTNWLMRYLKIDNNEIRFDESGKIVEVKLGRAAHMPRTIEFKKRFYPNLPADPAYDDISFSLFIRSAAQMGAKSLWTENLRIEADGGLSASKNRNRNIFVNLFRVAMMSIDPREN